MRFRASLAAFSLVLAYAGVSHGQGIVPGGWGPQVGYQSVGNIDVTSSYGLGTYPSHGPGVAYSPYGRYNPTINRGVNRPAFAPPARTVNGLGALGHVVGRTTRTRRVR